MAKLCPRGKAAAKRKFKVYPSAYANMYASAVCSGKVTPGGKKRKKAMGGGMMREGYASGGKIARGCGKVMSKRRKKTKTYFLMIRRPPRSTPLYSSAASDVYKMTSINLAVDRKGAKENIQNASHLQKPHG